MRPGNVLPPRAASVVLSLSRTLSKGPVRPEEPRSRPQAEARRLEGRGGAPHQPFVFKRGRRDSGFTLLEVILAFAILALGLTLAMRGATESMRNARLADEQTRAALHAQSILDTAGVGERLEAGTTEGEFDDGFTWRLDVAPYASETEDDDNGLDPADAAVQLMELDLVVSWQRDGRTIEARYRTLRALLRQS